MTKIRVPIKVSVYDKKTKKLITNSSSRLRTKILSNTAKLLNQYPASNHKYECTITYSKVNDSWNAFNFVNATDLNNKLAIFLELSLLKDLLKCKMMDSDCLK